MKVPTERGLSRESKLAIKNKMQRYVEQVQQEARDYPHEYIWRFASGGIGAQFGPTYARALEQQKEMPTWCASNFEEGSWLYEPDIDGSMFFRFKTEEQLMRFKLRWHNESS